MSNTIEDYRTIYCEQITCGKVPYVIEVCCNGYYLKLLVYPLAYIFEYSSHWGFGYTSVDREIKDGVVLWLESDHLNEVLVAVKPIADEMAKKTEKLIRRVHKIGVFS
jgi:hypothetical protein